MRTIYLVALNTFKETVRNKVLYNILLVAAVVLLLAMSFGDLSVMSRVQVMSDFGLATMSLTGLLLAVFIGVGVLGAEIVDKTVYGVLCKPVDRIQFIVGKFLGLFVTLALNFLLIALIFVTAITLMTGRAPQAEIFSAVLLLMVEMSVVIAAAIAWSCFTTPTLAAIFTLSFYVAGHLNDLITLGADAQSNPFIKAILVALHYILPNLEYFNIRTAVVFGLNMAPGHVSFAAMYGLLYTGLLLLISSVLFDRKDL
ncbi:MAG: ABC transporter permease subunit [Chitinispirillales bacterium]|jgi:ABC-type transport system involved in multi-copper enzyme maturation permease subunit|nr:ABC transporter permease subunit [Chitinispirillales bacterium]